LSIVIQSHGLGRGVPGFQEGTHSELAHPDTGVQKQYTLGKVTVPALRHVNLNMDRASSSPFAGPSGSGKTTLLNMLGFIDSPPSGKVYFTAPRSNTTDFRTFTGSGSRSSGYLPDV